MYSFICDECRFICPTIEEIKAHLSIVCEHCDFNTCSQELMNLHYQDKHRITCSMCDFVTTNLIQMVEHVNKYHQLMTCSKCDFKTRIKLDLDNHTNQNHPQIKCILCNFTSDTDGIVEHIKNTHLNQEEDDYDSDDDISDCEIIESNRPTFLCPKCSYRTKSTTYMKDHKLIVHKPGYEPFSCQKCPFKTSQRRLFLRHNGTHDSGNYLKCEHKDCHFISMTKSGMTRHTTISH